MGYPSKSNGAVYLMLFKFNIAMVYSSKSNGIT